MKKKYLIFGFLLLVSIAIAESDLSRVYLVELEYKNSALSLIGITLEEVYSIDEQSEGRYYYKIFDRDKVLRSSHFEINTEVYYTFEDEEGNLVAGAENLSSVNLTLSIPYYPRADRILFYGPNDNILLNIDVSEFSKKGFFDEPINVLKIMVVLLVLVLIIIVFLARKSSKHERKGSSRSDAVKAFLNR